MKINHIPAIVSLLTFHVSLLPSQVFMAGDGAGDAYKTIHTHGYDYEVPDCGHPVRHITEEWDQDLRKYVFAFTLHKETDNDRCINFDRQRCEIETDSASPATMQGRWGETHVYRWKFKLDAGFRPSPNFCHIHQIKADSGAPDSGMPLITITPRFAHPNKLQLIYAAPKGERGSGTLKEVDLQPFLGVWVEAYETATYERNGPFDLALRRVADDSLLFSYHSDTLNLWREGPRFNRPKYGIYRSLRAPEYLRDETVRFADFSLAEGEVPHLPAPPKDLKISAVSRGDVTIVWHESSVNEDQFRIERSTDGVTWMYHGTAIANSGQFTDRGLVAGDDFYYRVRSENAFGNSAFSEPVRTTLH